MSTNNKIVLTITEYMSELLYDIENKTFLTGKSRKNGNNYEEVANMQANENDEDLNQILRSVGNAWGTVQKEVSEYFPTDTALTGAPNNILQANSNLSMTLWMPLNYNKASDGLIATAIHQYIVNTAVGDWFAITNKNDAGDYYKESESNLMELREAINRRKRPERTTV